MRAAFIADVHAHNAKRHGGLVERSLNRRCRDTIDVLERAYRLAVVERCDMVCVLGDLVDSTSPEPQLVGELLRIVHDSAKGGVSTMLLVGNHDQQSDQEGDHALAPFVPFGDEAIVIEEPSAMRFGDAEFILLPHSAAAPAPKRLAALLSGLPPLDAGRVRVLLMHAGVSDDTTAPFLKGASDSVGVDVLADLASKAGVSWCLAGNWHDHKAWVRPFNGRPVQSVGVIQVGALVPTGFDNPGLAGYGGVAIFDSKDCSVRMHFLDGPRFVSVTGKKALVAALKSEPPKDRRLYLKATVDPDDLAEAAKLLSEAHASGRIVSGEVAPDAADRVVEARKAASAARSAGTLTDALDRFVSAMPLDEGVERGAVLEKCRGYLKTGG